MHSKRSILLALLAVCPLLLLVLVGAAAAAPVTVNLRVEGSTTTLFEGPVATEGETFATTSSPEAHPCNYSENGNSEGFTNGGPPAGTPTTALHDAAAVAGLPFDAKWSAGFGDFFVTLVGTDQNQSSGEFASWGYAVNNLTAPVGGCQIALAPGSEVLWAYNYFNLAHRLRLTAPSSANLGSPATVKVTDGSTGEPLAGMTVGETAGGVTTPLPGATTNSAGEATITLTHLGTVTLKAQGASAVRSNGVPVCVHNGNDGPCAPVVPPKITPVVVLPDIARATGVLFGHVYSRRAAPRVLRGIVTVPPGGTLRDVRISLQRRAGKRCWVLSNARGRFVRSRCGKASFFSVGDALSFSYLLPSRLAPGRYVYDVEAIDASGKLSSPSNGLSHVVFRVR